MMSETDIVAMISACLNDGVVEENPVGFAWVKDSSINNACKSRSATVLAR
jgi:hypothetical protein